MIGKYTGSEIQLAKYNQISCILSTLQQRLGLKWAAVLELHAGPCSPYILGTAKSSGDASDRDDREEKVTQGHQA